MTLTFRTFAVVVAVLSATLTFAQKPASSANDQKIIELERSVLTAFGKGDAKGFQQHLSPAALGIEPTMGVVKVTDWLAAMKDFKVQKWDMENAEVHWLNKDTAVLTYKYVATGSFMGQPLGPSWASSVWVNQNGAWKAAFHQESVVPPAPASRKK